MSLSLRRMILASTFAALPLAFASTASADDNPCGGIEVLAITECHFETSGGCTANCEPLKMTASCDGQCNAEISASCTADCSGGCEADCDVDPGSFDCAGSCTADCNASATTKCEAREDQAACESSAQASCKGDCDVQCEATPPTADCSAKCEASCSGSCESEANFDCNVDCSVELTGGCEAKCEEPQGALFCDGQFINVTDLPACVEYLLTTYEYELTIEIDVTATTSCTVADTRSQTGGIAGLFGLVALGGLAAARRRKKA